MNHQPKYGLLLKDPKFWRLVDIQDREPFGKNGAIVRSLGNTASLGFGKGGACVNFVAAGDYISYGADSNLQLSTMTGIAVLEVPAAATDLTIFNTNIGGSNSGGFVIYVTSTGAVQITKLDIASVILTSAAVKKGGGVSTVAWSYNNVTGLVRVAIDGVIQSTTSAQTFNHGVVARNLYYSGTGTYSSPHKANLLAISDLDTVSDQDLVRLSLNPYSIFKEPRTNQYRTVGSTPPPPAGGSGFVKVSGSWKTLSGTYVKVSGVWKQGTFSPKVSGSWKTLV